MQIEPRALLRPANLLSLVRLPLAALVWLRPEDPAFLFSVLGAAAVSDALDGFVARRAGVAPAEGTAHLGAWLDPLCDKAFVLSAAVAVAIAYEPPLVVLVLVALRDVLLLALLVPFRAAGGRAVFHQHNFSATWSGKGTTVAQFVTLLAVVVTPPLALPAAALTGALGALAVLVRVRHALADLRAHPRGR